MGAITICSGSLRGRRIETPAGDQTRPLLSRLRKTLADILRLRLPGARILDLFGGSGAIAFELLSNGAASACIVELSPAAADLIKKNARTLGLGPEVTVAAGDALASMAALARAGRHFDLIVVAPPYGRKLQKKAVEALAAARLLRAGGLIIVQRESREEPAGTPPGLVLARTRSYGRTVFDFYEAAPARNLSE